MLCYFLRQTQLPMTIEKISIRYSTTIPIASYGVNDKFDVEVVYSGVDNFEPLMEEIKNRVDAKVKQQYPHLFTESGSIITQSTVQVIQQEKPPPEETRIGLMAEDILSCKSLTVLKIYEKQVDKDPIMKKAYDKRHKELSKENV